MRPQRAGRRFVPKYCTAVLYLLLACDKPAPEPDYTGLGGFDTVLVRITTGSDTLDVRAELAETDEQLRLGLMERKHLGENEGMLFVYAAVRDSADAFWMYRTRIPLDIAFVDSTGVIVSIRSMEPCDIPNTKVCPKYRAGARFQSALEVNKGYFERHAVSVGDRIQMIK